MTSRNPNTGAKAIAALAMRDHDALPRETLRALFIEHDGNGARVAAELGLATAQPLMAAVDALGLREWLDAYRSSRRSA